MYQIIKKCKRPNFDEKVFVVKIYRNNMLTSSYFACSYVFDSIFSNLLSEINGYSILRELGGYYRQSLIRARVYMGLRRAVWFILGTRRNAPGRAVTCRQAFRFALHSEQFEKSAIFFFFAPEFRIQYRSLKKYRFYDFRNR